MDSIEAFIQVANEKFDTKLISMNDTRNIATLRSNINDDEEAKCFIEMYGQHTQTHWIVNKTFLFERLVYHKVWACQHSRKNKSSSSKRNTYCEAKIDIKIKKNNKNTRKNDPFLKEDVPLRAVILINFDHNHTIGTAGSLKYLRTLPQVKEQFVEYFNSGLGPSTAMRLHEEKILLQDDAYVKMADSSLNPTPSTVYDIHRKWREENFGNEKSTFTVLKEKMEQNVYTENGAIVKFHEESPWAILVVTSIMKRAHTLPSSSELIFCDSSASCDSRGSTITILLTATKAGAVPIAVLIHENQTTDGYKTAFSLLRHHFPNCFGNKAFPCAFMTDDSASEKAALAEIWPHARQLLCHFHVAQTEWRWLLASKNGVPSSKRRQLMKN